MSRHLDMLVKLGLLGKSPERIAAEVPMSLPNVLSTLEDDWPIQKRFVAPLEAYVQGVMRRAYFHAVAEITRKRRLRADTAATQLVDGLRVDFAKFFDASIDGGTPPRPFNGQQAVRALQRLGIPPAHVAKHSGIRLAQVENILHYGMTRPDDTEPLIACTRALLILGFHISERLSIDEKRPDMMRQARSYMTDVIDTWRYLFDDGTEVFEPKALRKEGDGR